MTTTGPSEIRPSDTIVFPSSSFERAIADAVCILPPPALWPSVMSLRHLNRAWKLLEHDTDMALFRALTAEEEAARAIFLVLKHKAYPGAGRLRDKDHLDKNALSPFLIAIETAFARAAQSRSRPFVELQTTSRDAAGRAGGNVAGAHNIAFFSSFPDLTLVFDTQAHRPTLRLEVAISDPVTARPLQLRPYPPLHFAIRRGPARGQLERADFQREMDEIAKGSGAGSIREYLNDLRQRRNRLLYAEPSGYYATNGDFPASILQSKQVVFKMLKILLLIAGYRKRQLFVQQALDAFVGILSQARR